MRRESTLTALSMTFVVLAACSGPRHEQRVDPDLFASAAGADDRIPSDTMPGSAWRGDDWVPARQGRMIDRPLSVLRDELAFRPAKVVHRPKSARQRFRAPSITQLRLSTADGTGEFASVLRELRLRTDVPIITTPDARRVAVEEGLSLDIDLRYPTSAASVLDLLIASSDRLETRIERGIVYVESRKERRERMTLVYYDVRQLVMSRTVFIAPRLDMGIPTGDDDTVRTGTEGEERVQTFDPDGLLETLRIGTDPEFWADAPGASMELGGAGTLIVRATADIHRQIRALLGS